MNNDRHAKIGDVVKVHFIGKLDDGSIFETSQEKSPLIFKVGNGDVIQGIDEAVIGMQIGQLKNIHITSDKAYGSYEKALVISVKKEDLPKNIEIKLGQELRIPGEDETYLKVRITNITDKYVELDGNHQLSGKNLIFEIKLIEIS